jgi:hypothetical protein
MPFFYQIPSQVTYFKNVGLWFLPDDDDACIASDKMLAWVNTNGDSGSGNSNSNSNQLLSEGGSEHQRRSIKDRCCRVGDYWLNTTSSKTAVDAATRKQLHQ